MLTGNESLDDLDKKRSELESEIKTLHGASKREKESHLQDVQIAIEKLKKNPKKDEIKY
jgi:chaperonin cofactor prefoldin